VGIVRICAIADFGISGIGGIVEICASAEF
jgi:hypothetical protein